jgi:hypothetical protein
MKTQNKKENQNGDMKKKFKKYIKKYASVICIGFASFFVLVGVLIALFQAEEELVEYTIKNEKLYTYSGDIRLDFDTEITLDYEDNVAKM